MVILAGGIPTHYGALVGELAAAAWVGYHLIRRFHRPRRRPVQPAEGGNHWYRTVYLDSEHWRWFRHHWWQAHGGIANCHVCGQICREHHADLHHLTYARIGHELLSDVVAVHRACHDEIEAGKRHHAGEVSPTWPLGPHSLHQNRDADPFDPSRRLRRPPTHPETRPCQRP